MFKLFILKLLVIITLASAVLSTTKSEASPYLDEIAKVCVDNKAHSLRNNKYIRMNFPRYKVLRVEDGKLIVEVKYSQLRKYGSSKSGFSKFKKRTIVIQCRNTN